MKTRVTYIGSLVILALVVVVALLRVEIRSGSGAGAGRTAQEVQLLEQPSGWVLQVNLRNDLADAATYEIAMKYEGAETSSEFWIEPGKNIVFTRHALRAGQMDVSITRDAGQRVVLDQFTLRIPDPSASNLHRDLTPSLALTGMAARLP